MRPVRIEVEGFAAFRSRAVVDLADTDLFALVGPTGAGKSTVIDAMVFALYGSVPRYGSKGLVYPVITQGALEAKVRLDFVVGETPYTATRVVRRTKTGATTKEARLEQGDDVLAADAEGLSVAVADLLGLDLEQFTKCVVLPQGEFAALLHDTKATRQDLLVKLLDLGLYERLATAARAETKRAGQRVEFLDEQLARSAHATETAVAGAADRVHGLAAVVGALDRAMPRRTALDETIAAADAAIATASVALEPLASVRAPDEITEITRAAADAASAVTEAEDAEHASAQRVAAAAAAVDALPDATSLRGVADDRVKLAEVDERVAKGTALLVEVDADVEAAAGEVESATERQRRAEADRDRARVADAAADLARHLHEGDDCPVCGNRIDALPSVDATVLAAADRSVAEAVDALRAATARLIDHQQKAAAYRAKLDEREGERRRLAERLVDAPTDDEVAELLAHRTTAETALRDARTADDAARAEATRRRAASEDASRRVAAARASFAEVRDRVAVLGPPRAGDDLAADWKELVQWAEGEHARHAAAVDDARNQRAAASAERDAEQAALADQAVGAGVEREPVSTLRDRTVSALATAQATHDQLARELSAAAELRAERDQLDERRQVHELLADQLGARGFEAWLLEEALDALLDGASEWLEQLSSGRYAMAVDDKKQFAVIDHANADERRIARTLSGGETFLASLALALALAERVSELSSTGGTTLEAIFLDEGFGTLDPDTLDVVATAIEELGATGRMVGIISHVADLAERVPVRFEVTKSPGTSTIERVDA